MNIEEWPNLILTDPEKKSLVTWLRRCSRGRFADTDLARLDRAMRRPTCCKDCGKFAHPASSSPPYRTPTSPPSVYRTPMNPFHYPSVHGISYPSAQGLGLGTRPTGQPPFPTSRVFLPAHRPSLRSVSAPTPPIATNQSLQRFVSGTRGMQPSSFLAISAPSNVLLASRKNARWTHARSRVTSNTPDIVISAPF